MAKAPSSQALMEGELGSREEQAQELESGFNRLIPEDGHSWKKYGQKFIKNIQRNRSYFRCQKKKCKAKKRIDWCSSNPSRLRVLYQGQHDHPSSGAPHSSSTVSQYDLLSQVFGPSIGPS